MYEKILQKLKQQRGTTSNVSDRSLEDLAKSLESVITTDEMLNAADLTNAIKSIDGNINYYAAEAVKREAERKKADEEAARKKKEDEAKKNKTPEVNPDDVPIWAKSLMEQNQQLADKLSGLEKNKAKESRLELLKGQLKDLPEFYTKPILAGFDRLAFEKDEDFDSYLTEVKNSSETFIQTAKEQGLNTVIPSKDVKTPEPSGQTSVLKEAQELVLKAKETAAAKS